MGLSGSVHPDNFSIIAVVQKVLKYYLRKKEKRLADILTVFVCSITFGFVEICYRIGPLTTVELVCASATRTGIISISTLYFVISAITVTKSIISKVCIVSASALYLVIAAARTATRNY
jgi:hypothetical protein